MARNEFLALAVTNKIETVEPKQELFTQGIDGGVFFALVKGSVLLKNKNEIVEAPATLGIEDLLHGRCYTDTAVAIDGVSIIRLQAEHLSSFVKLCPGQAIEVMKSLAGVEKIKSMPTTNSSSGDAGAIEQKLEIAKSVLGIPEGQRLYGDIIDIPTTANYLHDTEFTCPICSTKFKEKSILYSLLRTVKTGFDLRIEFKDFDPMWYNILVCPKCKYAGMEKGYNDVGRNEAAKITAKLKKNGFSDLDKIYSEKRTIDEVIIAYHIAINCWQELNDNEIMLAKLWLNLVWLYEDVGDRDMVLFASQKALDHYIHIYQYTRKLETPEAEQQIFMIMAELYLRLENKEQAMQFLSQAFKSESNNRVYKEKCRRKYEDLKYGE